MTENGAERTLFVPIANIITDFPDKFGVPRQSGLIDELEAKIVFLPEYRVPEAIRGIEQYSHLWLIWHFSQTEREGWSPTVRPPRLGGNTRVGVFATRSPFRPNPVGLSCVRLDRVEHTPAEGDVLFVRGADMVSGTPIFDIKPYLPYVDSHPEALGGFSDTVKDYSLDTDIPQEYTDMLPPVKLNGLRALLASDPRPAYQRDESRVYGLFYAGFEIKFRVCGKIAEVVGIESAEKAGK